MQIFDPKKKGFITLSDLKENDRLGRLSQMQEDDLRFIFKGIASPTNKSITQIRERMEYPNFVKMFMPGTDKRFTQLIIQRSEKNGGKAVELSRNTRELANQLIKSTAVFYKYKSMVTEQERNVQEQTLLDPFQISEESKREIEESFDRIDREMGQ